MKPNWNIKFKRFLIHITALFSILYSQSQNKANTLINKTETLFPHSTLCDEGRTHAEHIK